MRIRRGTKQSSGCHYHRLWEFPSSFRAQLESLSPGMALHGCSLPLAVFLQTISFNQQQLPQTELQASVFRVTPVPCSADTLKSLANAHSSPSGWGHLMLLLKTTPASALAGPDLQAPRLVNHIDTPFSNALSTFWNVSVFTVSLPPSSAGASCFTTCYHQRGPQ